MLKKVPVPICGLILGLAALGNLLQSYSEGLRYACGIVAGILLVLFLLKCVMYPKMILEDLKNPIMASVLATFPMALMLLSVYLKPWIGTTAMYVWFLAIALHILLIIYFTITFIAKLVMTKVFASYFIVYVGIAVAGITTPAYDKLAIGAAAFWFGLICLIALLVLVTVRYVKYKEVPAPAKPLICIYAAPTSLCIAAYVQSVTPKMVPFLLTLYVLACIFYVFSLIKMIGYLKLPFFPSYAAFTFPFVISAIASKQTMNCVAKLGTPIPVLEYVVLVQTVIAVLAVAYVLVRYLAFLSAKPQTVQK